MASEDIPHGTALHPEVEKSLAEYGINHEVLACDPELADTAAFCEHYGVSLEQAANTILVASRKVDPPKYAICVVLGTTRLDVNKTVRKLRFNPRELVKLPGVEVMEGLANPRE